MKQKAFTLIELLIVIGIIGVMAVLAVPTFNDYGAKAELDNKTDQIKLILDTFYQKSVSPDGGSNGSFVAIGTDTITSKIGTCISNTFTPTDTEVFKLDEGTNADYKMTISGGNTNIKSCSPGNDSDIKMVNAGTLTDNILITVTRVGSGLFKNIVVQRYPFKVEIQ